jgi:hypothetical protein
MHRKMIRNVLIGLGCISLLHLFLVVLVGCLIFAVSNPDMQSTYWIIRAVSIAFPVVLWIVLRAPGSGTQPPDS